ncbi:MAG TPA: HEAT repeat domain-containing protein [Gemmatimonadales bacterium]|jgi:HEAT repeat protein
MPQTPAAFAARLALLNHAGESGERDRLILEGFRDPDPALREVAMAWGARVMEPTALVPHLAEAADATLRNSALGALERQGPYATECLIRLVTDPDADTAMFACQALGQIGGPVGEMALLMALARPEVNVVHAAAEALGRIGSRRAVPALVELLQREPWLQLAALDALGTIGHPDAAPAILALVPDGFVAGPALTALGRIGAPSSIDRLVTLIVDPAHQSLRPELLGALGAALESADSWPDLGSLRAAAEDPHDPAGLRRFLAGQLGTREADEKGGGDDRRVSRGGSPLTRAAGTVVIAARLHELLPLVLRWAAGREARGWVGPLAARCPAAITGALGAVLTHDDPEVRAGALYVAPPGAVSREQLLVALGDASPRVRTAACQALGILGDPTVVPSLVARLGAADLPERNAVIAALARFPEAALAPVLAPAIAPAADQLTQAAALLVLAQRPVPALADAVLKLAARSPAEVRRAALSAAAGVPGSKAEMLLFRALADTDPAVQMDALDHLVARGGERIGTTLIALLGTADSFRYHVIRALGRLGLPGASGPLQALFAVAPLHEQIEIVTALSRIPSEAARSFLTECIHHSELEVRRVAAQGLARQARPGELEMFQALATNPDWVIRTEAARALGRLEQPEGRKSLLDLARDLEPTVARTARAALAGRT